MFLNKEQGQYYAAHLSQINACTGQLDPLCIIGCLALQTLTRQKGIKSQEV